MTPFDATPRPSRDTHRMLGCTSTEPSLTRIWENGKAAEADYAVALRDEASRIRVQARQHDEVVRLMALDQIGVSARDQEMYLLRKGFITGRELSPERVAARYRASADEVNRITSGVEAQLLSMTSPSPDQETSHVGLEAA